MAKRATPAAAPTVFSDATVSAVMVGNAWHEVVRGSWRVDLRPPFVHASWRDPESKTRVSAFLSHVQLVRHGHAARGR